MKVKATQRDFWSKAVVGVLGGGSWGTVLCTLLAPNCRDIRLWLRDEEVTKAINSTRSNPKCLSHLTLPANVHAYSDLQEFFREKISVLIWALPSEGCRSVAKRFAPFLSGEEFVLHATKGVEAESMKRISEILSEELPLRRIGVISGPNLAYEIAENQPAATVVASKFHEVLEAGYCLLNQDRFRVFVETDVIGIEWAGTLKNILAIAAGALDAMQLGWSARAMLMTRGLHEIVRFSTALGARESTFLGLAGMGDLLATCGSPLSRNYRVGFGLAKGESLESVLKKLGSTAEGVTTSFHVSEFAKSRRIAMPITQGVSMLLKGEMTARGLLEPLVGMSKIAGD